GFQPAVQRGARATDMQIAGGTGGEAGAAGHGRIRCRRNARILARRVAAQLAGSPGESVGPDARSQVKPAGVIAPYNRGMTTLFIADLHLDPAGPEITRLFGDFLEGEARGARALYILGDLFESWVGDDDPSDAGVFVATRLRALSDAGIPVYFQRGNRDFLLGDAYARRAGMTILPD